MKDPNSKKKDRKSLRVARWKKRNCCPECGCICDKDYLQQWHMCMDCYMKNIGMSWSDFY